MPFLVLLLPLLLLLLFHRCVLQLIQHQLQHSKLPPLLNRRDRLARPCVYKLDASRHQHVHHHAFAKLVLHTRLIRLITTTITTTTSLRALPHFTYWQWP
jgi:hypothetical protein